MTLYMLIHHLVFLSTIHVFIELGIVYSQQKEPLEFGELEWLTESGLLGEPIPQETLAAAEVPQLPMPQSSNVNPYRPTKSSTPFKKPRLEMPVDDDEFFIVPDLG